MRKEAFLPETKEALEIVGRREANTHRKEECLEKKVDQEIERKNDLQEKMGGQNLWEEAEREDLGRILVAFRDINPWEQVANKNYSGSKINSPGG